MDDTSIPRRQSPGVGRILAEKAAKRAAKKALAAALKTPIGMKIAIILLLVFVILAILGMIVFYLFITAVVDRGGGTFGVGGRISDAGSTSIPAEYLPIYFEAEAEFDVPWNLLAAVHRVETVFSTYLEESYAGAVGHMQFMPCTWVGWSHPSCSGLGRGDFSESELVDPFLIARHGGYGLDADGDGRADPWNIRDAIFSAAGYLAANGAAEGNYEQALFAYNHSQRYVQDVLGFAMEYIQLEDRIPVDLIDGAAFPVPEGMYVTSGFGMRWGRVHNGVDIAATGDSTGANIVAFSSGYVEFSGEYGGYGYTVIIDHGGGVKTLYAHMLEHGRIRQGVRVGTGESVGLVGNSGNSRGSHLHFEIRINGTPVDPLPYLLPFNPIITGGSNL
ncbi:peptidoglycan DD-metalloendopeptidase family protein [Paenibacillus sp. 1P07SE]|uniref:peptidoglycan DD-metalloendopeptidase family protein n=1 Tax=Paenibacillus sp. 1P07SE TaxID=3132209 RepID=UPI0039A50D86